MNDEIYDRFDSLRFLLIVFVIFIHNAKVAEEAADVPDIYFLEYLVDFMSGGLASVAVPLFFLMSGFLFFGRTPWTRAVYRRKLASRVRTLFVPYIFWNVALFLFLAALQAAPQAAGFFSGAAQSYGLMNPAQILNLIFGFTQYPVAYQFWFIRDLMILVVLGPLVYWASRTLGPVLVTLLAALWFVGFWPIHTPALPAILFFTLGCYLAVSSRDPFPPRWTTWPLVLGGVLLFALDPLVEDEALSRVMHCAGILLGGGGTLALSGMIVESVRLNAILSRLSLASFFTFAVHEPLLTILRKLVYRATSLDVAGAAALYLVLPIVVGAVAAGLYFLLRLIAPRPLAFVAG